MKDLSHLHITGKVNRNGGMFNDVQDFNVAAKSLRFRAQPNEVSLSGPFASRLDQMSPVEGGEALSRNPSKLTPNFKGVKFIFRKVEVTANGADAKSTDDKVACDSGKQVLCELLGLRPCRASAVPIGVDHL